ncbi:MAG: hypothetical protein U0U67_10920 [Chitinophagales bacterium]
MTALQTQKIKDKLIRKIQKTNDINLLGKVELALNEKEEEQLLLTKSEKTILKQRLNDVKNGIGIPHKDVMKEMKEWLQTK